VPHGERTPVAACSHVVGEGRRLVVVDYVSLPTMPHSLHGHDERLYLDTLLGWVEQLDAPA
jgi:hypothetical protein